MMVGKLVNSSVQHNAFLDFRTIIGEHAAFYAVGHKITEQHIRVITG